MENKSFVQNRMACVMREGKAKFKRAIVLDEVEMEEEEQEEEEEEEEVVEEKEEEEDKLHCTECMNNVIS